jgi:hypothetical protein
MAKTRKGSRKASRKASTRKAGSWAQKATAVYREMKRKNPATRFADALKEAARRKKAGTL